MRVTNTKPTQPTNTNMTTKMTNQEIKNLLMKFNDFCLILNYRALTPAEDEEMLKIEALLDALD
jgi:hypothetical protein